MTFCQSFRALEYATFPECLVSLISQRLTPSTTWSYRHQTFSEFPVETLLVKIPQSESMKRCFFESASSEIRAIFLNDSSSFFFFLSSLLYLLLESRWEITLRSMDTTDVLSNESVLICQNLLQVMNVIWILHVTSSLQDHNKSWSQFESTRHESTVTISPPSLELK